MDVLGRAVALLQAVADGARTVGQLAEATGVSRSTTRRLTLAMTSQGWLRRDPGGEYRLGRRMAELGSLADENLLLGLCRRSVYLLSAATGAGAHAHRRVGDQRECVATVNKSMGLRDVVPLGPTEPWGDDAVGLVLRAWAPPRMRSADADHPAVLREVRDRGWASTTLEHVTCIAVPVRMSPQEVGAVLSLTGDTSLALETDALVRRLQAAASLLAEGLRAQAYLPR
ncbi:IclR family transcriptional regulator [Streptomyces sp. NPDC050528]|uniref:IclR family transcriptional regulator n=1 Tax=unclassified Streptomyces TaxID=2593676 RepID=UPI00379479EE